MRRSIMSRAVLCQRGRTWMTFLMAVVCAAGPVSRSLAQGCFPIRYTSPTLGDQTSSPQGADLWQVGLAYRWLHATRFYSGDYIQNPCRFGCQTIVNISTRRARAFLLADTPVRRELGHRFRPGTLGTEDVKPACYRDRVWRRQPRRGDVAVRSGLSCQGHIAVRLG
jgi:hypothetical protein